MEFGYLPKDYAALKEEEAEERIEQEEKKADKQASRLNKEANQKRKTERSEFLQEHPEGDFSDYLRFLARYKYLKFSWVFAVLGAIMGIIFYKYNHSWLSGSPLDGLDNIFTNEYFA